MLFKKIFHWDLLIIFRVIHHIHHFVQVRVSWREVLYFLVLLAQYPDFRLCQYCWKWVLMVENGWQQLKGPLLAVDAAGPKCWNRVSFFLERFWWVYVATFISWYFFYALTEVVEGISALTSQSSLILLVALQARSSLQSLFSRFILYPREVSVNSFISFSRGFFILSFLCIQCIVLYFKRNYLFCMIFQWTYQQIIVEYNAYTVHSTSYWEHLGHVQGNVGGKGMVKVGDAKMEDVRVDTTRIKKAEVFVDV